MRAVNDYAATSPLYGTGQHASTDFGDGGGGAGGAGFAGISAPAAPGTAGSAPVGTASGGMPTGTSLDYGIDLSASPQSQVNQLFAPPRQVASQPYSVLAANGGAEAGAGAGPAPAGQNAASVPTLGSGFAGIRRPATTY